MRAVARARVFRACVLLTAAVSALACRPDRGTSSPAGGAGVTGRTHAAAVSLAYRPARLRARVTVELTTNGGGRYLEASTHLTTIFDVAPAGETLLFAWTIEKVDGVTLQGTVPRGDHDLGQFLVAHGKGAWVLDRSGTEDVAATDSHARNAPRRELLDGESARLAEAHAAGRPADPEPAAALLELLPPLLQLPRLPARPLTLGETVESTSSSELELPSMQLVLPVETTSKATLIGVDDAGAVRLAELQVDVLRYGGLDTEGGAVELEEHVEGTLLFDIDNGFPVRIELTTTQSFTAGDRGGDSTAIVRAELERA